MDLMKGEKSLVQELAIFSLKYLYGAVESLVATESNNDFDSGFAAMSTMFELAWLARMASDPEKWILATTSPSSLFEGSTAEQT
jgi:hypothetical protein